jgi:hypothetical protein
LLSNKIDVTVASKVAIFPKSGGYLPGDAVTVSVTPRSGGGITYSYHWKVAGASNLTMQDQTATHTGLDFTTPDPLVRIVTTPSTQGAMTVTCSVSAKDSLVGSAAVEFKLYPYSNQILVMSSAFPTHPQFQNHFSYVLLKKDATKTVAPTIRWSTYVDGTLKAVSSRPGTLMTKVYDMSSFGDPNVGPPYLIIDIKTTQFMDPDDKTFTVNEVPYPYDLGDAIAIVLAYESWDSADTTSGRIERSIKAVDDWTARTQVVAGLVYP